MGDTAREETTEAAVRIVGAAAELARVFLGGRCSELPAAACTQTNILNINLLSLGY